MVVQKPLTVYKASAGSGKTFTLATEYMKLLVLNPMSYRNILAVTFTNKATEEMKVRILSQLYGISKHLPESAAYLNRIMADTGLPEDVVCQRASDALHQLLHNYHFFRVETIDSFFQSVLRNLARELDLTANLRIGLNDIQVEEQAVDQLIDSLHHTDILLQWLLSYIMDTISEDHSWNIIGQVKQFGRTIFRDFYKEHRHELKEKMQSPDFFGCYQKQLRELRDQSQKKMAEIAQQFFDILESENLSVDNLAYGNVGVGNFFQKLKMGQFDESIIGRRVCDCVNDPSCWYSKKKPKADQIHALAEASLMPLLSYAMEVRPQQYRLFKSAELTLKHLNQLRLLGSIEKKVHDLNEESNRFLLSDTQQLLHTLIKDSDSPFIFEKIGTQLEHIMIDEFQDTSSVQWKNFKVLLNECISHSPSENLIVGDVKQSIYRWRSGDWRLLNNIEKEFTQASDMLHVESLKTNYRSDRRIVTFNNAFFTEAARQEYEMIYESFPEGAEQLRQAYADVEQEIPEHRPDNGYINIRLLPADNYLDNTLQELDGTVCELLEKGSSVNDIAILVRNNKYIPLIADYLSTRHADLHIVSDEAFRLDSSVAVNILVQALHLLTHPEDQLSKATIVKLYHHFVLADNTAEPELLIKDQPLEDLLPDDYILHTTELLRLPLYELVERLYAVFQLDRLNEQSAYICAFYDQLIRFSEEHTTEIKAFLREWEETLCGKTIQSDVTNGLRIMSIHKSKGLEFRHVIIPFCDWKLEQNDILWCQPQEAPFNELPLVPIDYSGKQMPGTTYEHDYLVEHLQNTVDNLNLLYVAFTRAVNSLHVIGQKKTKNSRSVRIECVLPALQLQDAICQGDGQEDDITEYSYGTLSCDTHPATAHHTDNVFLQPAIPIQADIHTYHMKASFRQSNKSHEFIENHGEEELSYIKMGSILHQVFSTIHTVDDIEKALSQLQHDGILYDDEITAEKLTKTISKRLNDHRVKDWFSNKWNIFNECSILQLTPEGEVQERRPDRVITNGHETHVVDFKFGRPRPEYHDQVRTYMKLLTTMGLPCVKGWLWYVYSNQIEEVQPHP